MLPGSHLHILWTSDDPVTWREMVVPYAGNSLKYGWWERVTLIVWGASTALAARDTDIQRDLAALADAGVELTACRACAENLGADAALARIGVDVRYWGEALARVQAGGGHVLTV